MRPFPLMCWLPSRAALLLLLASSLAAGCKKAEPQAKEPVKYNGPLLESTNVLTLYSDSAKLQIRYTAPLEQQFENGDQLYPKGLLVTFFDKSGQKVVNRLSGKYCKYEKAKNLYTMRGNVRVNNEEKQQRMYTEELFYDKQRNVVYTDSATFAQFVTPTDSLTGYGLFYNMTTSRYLFKRPAGQFIVEPATTTPQ
ncbi:LPS export ABC transporter periplasmic protein LptC [Hymenobacter sp. YC55]|uniref:LPS export ABC transporter periplasmic protein LptC n=1 Tax=Hymenobacter sp. YC55 TaxID=3034019 RepID=UPI0023F7F357|nr:LPS export ABC transporter periplasmic protein LptC [Hymenobacter sp. YC55]MDF7812416.1 LPS export ABC transporter periplasmic protein LptC [Hymenobacter sp. YC55]